MYILDTCTLSEYLGGDETVAARINATPKGQSWISVVTLEGSLQGVISAIRAEKEGSRKVGALYARLEILVKELSKYPILPFDNHAEAAFRQLPSETRKISTNDRRIAAISIATGKVVVTANLRHFEKLLPESQLQDWTRPE